MLETVERISNISKCRDLINFEFLLYRTLIIILMIRRKWIWIRKSFILKNLNNNFSVDCRRQNTAKAIFCFILNPRSRFIEMYLILFEIGIYPGLLNGIRTNNSLFIFYLQRGRIVWSESLLKGLIYEIRNEFYYR